MTKETGNREYIEIAVQDIQLLTADQAWHYNVIPKEVRADTIIFYGEENTSTDQLVDELEMIFGKEVNISPLPKQILCDSLSRYYRRSNKDSELTDKQQTSFIEKSDDFVLRLIEEANEIGSSDIHIEKYESKCRVRYRVDGKLVEKYIVSNEEYPSIVNKLKIMGNMDIAEKRLPQDGRISFESNETKFDIRVSVLPTLFGEKVVMRLLSKDATDIDILNLGFSKNQLASYLEGVKRTSGIVLISGPTGSGKTTTLYATLKELNNEKTNIITIEDPIEYTLPGINQVQLKESIGLTFAGALRSFLRQDPDIIMLGEIRDVETAKMAIRAALTGHLVLSTIHTNSAWGTVSRLIDMGVPSYLISGTLNITAAQRLVRLLCDKCKQEVKIEIEQLPQSFKMPYEVHSVYEPVGCEACFYTGYAGRKALYEIIPVDEEFSELIKAESFNVNAKIKEKKIERLMDNAFDLLANGSTSIEEVYYLLMSTN